MTSDPPPPGRKQITELLVIWIAQGFGSGRIQPGPGTWGSLVGILWFLLLLVPANPWIFYGGTIAGILISILFCDLAEKILKQKDPGHIVIDEICAIPLCFWPWVYTSQKFPTHNTALDQWPTLLLVFILFRIFDIAKPWPIRQSQSIKGGLGTTIDDILAALVVAAIHFAYLKLAI